MIKNTFSLEYVVCGKLMVLHKKSFIFFFDFIENISFFYFINIQN